MPFSFYLSIYHSPFYNLKTVMNPKDPYLSVFLSHSIEEILDLMSHCNARALWEENESYFCLWLWWVGVAKTIAHLFLLFFVANIKTSQVHHCHKFMQKHTLSLSSLPNYIFLRFNTIYTKTYLLLVYRLSACFILYFPYLLFWGYESLYGFVTVVE